MAFSCFLQLDGIKGESTIQGYKDWIEVGSWSIGVAQPMSHAVSTSGQQTAARADFHPLGIHLKVDKATNELFLKCAAGEHIKKGELHICRQTKEHELVYKISLDDIVVASLNLSASSGSPEVGVNSNLSYSKVHLEYKQFDVSGKPQGQVAKGWDLKSNKAA